MALGSPFIVRIEMKSRTSFGDTMNEIRTWLDHRRIEPISFLPVAEAATLVGF